MKSLAFALACSLLVACGAKQQDVKPVIVDKPVQVDVAVAVPCLKKIPLSSVDFLSDAALLTGSGAQVADNLWADHLGRRDYENKLISAIQACIAPPGK